MIPKEFIRQAKCYRNVCRNPHDYLWNNSTQAFYCRACRNQITQWPENAHLFEDRMREDVLKAGVGQCVYLSGFPYDYLQVPIVPQPKPFSFRADDPGMYEGIPVATFRRVRGTNWWQRLD